jgi:circadian clock protein KaiC
LDNAFSPGGIYRGSSTLITGNAGTSKTILAAHFAMSSCNRNERTLYFSFEESPNQLIRNMATIGIDFEKAIQSNLLHIQASRPSLLGLEMHLMVLNKLLVELKPRTVIIDPISSLITIGNNSEVRAMLVRLMDTLKINQINALFTSLTHDGYYEYNNSTVDAVSSLADTWIDLKNEERNHERVRTLLIVKSRGMGHSNSHKDFIITNKGIEFTS